MIVGLYGNIDGGSSIPELSAAERLTGGTFNTNGSTQGTILPHRQSSPEASKCGERLVRLRFRAQRVKGLAQRASGVPPPGGIHRIQGIQKGLEGQWQWKSLESLPSDVPSIDYQTTWFGADKDHRLYHCDADQSSSLSSTRLPFPLISLPQAAFLQHKRIESGEEDHTDYGSSFANRTASTTISSLSSPISPYIAHRACLGNTWGETGSSCTPNQAVELLHNGTGRSTGKKSHDDNADNMLTCVAEHYNLNRSGSSIALIDRKCCPTILSRPGEGEGRNTLSVSPRNRIPKMLRLQDTCLEHGSPFDEPKRYPQSALFTDSETRIIESARKDILHRRRCSVLEQKRVDRIYRCTVFVSIIFPFAALLALFGILDTTLLWYTKGQISSFNGQQRSLLRRLLLVQVVLYTALAVALVVYFATSH